MTKRSLRIAGIVPCFLMALQLEAPPGLGRTSGPTLFVPTFVPGCALSPPQVRSAYKGTGKPTPRPRYAFIEVFLAGKHPEHPYVVVGEVQISTRERNASLWNLIDYAKREARKMGGDAIVDVVPLSRSKDPRSRVLKATIVRWV